MKEIQSWDELQIGDWFFEDCFQDCPFRVVEKHGRGVTGADHTDTYEHQWHGDMGKPYCPTLFKFDPNIVFKIKDPNILDQFENPIRTMLKPFFEYGEYLSLKFDGEKLELSPLRGS